MKSLLAFILGILGLASLAGGAFFAIQGGGLAKTLKAHDSELQELDELERKVVLDAWVADMQFEAKNLDAAERRDTIGPSIADLQAEILSTLDRADKKISALSKAWHETEEGAKEADVALQNTEENLTQAEASYAKLDDAGKVKVKADAAEISRAIDEKYEDEDVAKHPEMKERLDRVRALLNKLQ